MNKEADTSFEIYHLKHFLEHPHPEQEQWELRNENTLLLSSESLEQDVQGRETHLTMTQREQGYSVYRAQRGPLSKGWWSSQEGWRRWEPFKRLLKDEDWLDTVQIQGTHSPIQRLLKSSESVFFVPGSLTVSTVPITSEAFRKRLMNYSECKGKEELCYQFSIFSTFIKVFLTYMEA